MNPQRKTILYILLINLSFIATLFLLRHAWQMSETGIEASKAAYPRFYFLLLFAGKRSIELFTITLGATILLNLFFLRKILNKTTATLLFTSTAIALIIAEIALRKIGYSPSIQPSAIHSFKPTDTL